MKYALLVALGGALGALARYALTGLAARLAGAWPLGTLVVNALGCLAAGWLLFAVETHGVSPRARALLGVGVLGALTTFSTFGVDTFELLRTAGPTAAFGNVALNLALGLGGVAGGYWLAGLFAASTD